MLSGLGYSSNESVGTSIESLFGQRMDRADSKRMSDAIATMSSAQCELRLYRLDVSAFWSDWRGHSMPEDIGGARR
jgi:hypothetical protein